MTNINFEKLGDKVEVRIGRKNMIFVTWRGETQTASLYKDCIRFQDRKFLDPNGKPVTGFSITEEIRKQIREEIKEREEKVEKLANDLEVIGFFREIGCDCSDTIKFNYKVTRDAFQNDQDKEFAELEADAENERWYNDQLLIDDNRNIIFNFEGEKINKKESDSYSYGSYEYGKEDAQKLYKKMKDEQRREIKEREQEIEKRKLEDLEHLTKCKKEATKYNREVVYKTYTVDCNSRHEECNEDIIFVYVNPDGNLTEKRVHQF